MAPELVEGKQATTLSDIYSLGVVLYQMVIGDFSRTVAPGWEREVEDELLREDIAACLDGNPERRLPSAGELAQRLRNLDERRSQRRTEAEASTAAARNKRRRRLYFATSIAAAAVAVIAGAFAIQQSSLRAVAEEERERANDAANEAREARFDAEQREAELKLVSDFQGSMLSGIDVELMGRRLIEDLVADARAAMERRGDDEETIAAAAVDIEASLSAVNPTNVALRSLDRNVRARALARSFPRLGMLTFWYTRVTTDAHWDITRAGRTDGRFLRIFPDRLRDMSY